MNMEELTKSQIILLTLFVSFVTSIATGIVTVALMAQTPPAITQSVSRVIRETVQTVVPASASQSASVITQEKTVVINESELISKAVQRAEPSIVRLFSGSGEEAVFLGLGIVLDENGTVATDASALGDSAEARVVLHDGLSVRQFVRKRDEKAGLAYLSPATSTSPAPRWVAVSIASDHVVLGQSVVALSGKSATRIGDGLILALVSGPASTSPQIIETSVGREAILPGSPLINTQGVLVGISTGPARALSDTHFMSADAVRM